MGRFTLALDAMLRAPTWSRVCRETAPGADEFRLRATVRLVDVAALGARPARVARVHGDKGNTGEGGLVAEERAELEERPRVEHRALRLANRYPVTDAAEISTAIPRPVSLALRTIDLLMT